MTDKKKTILEAVEKLTDTYRKEELFLGKDRERLPNKKEIINFIKDMRSIIFPGQTVNVCQAFTLTDESDVTVQAQEAFSFDEDATARQILKVK